MPGRRSYHAVFGPLSAAQVQRKERDEKFKTKKSSTWSPHTAECVAADAFKPDVVYLDDPWSRKCALKRDCPPECVNPPPPSSGASSLNTDVNNAEDEKLIVLRASLHQAEALICTQNDTSAMLTAELERLKFSCVPLCSPVNGSYALDCDVKALATSLPVAVDKSLCRRAPSIVQPLIDKAIADAMPNALANELQIDKRVHAGIMEALQGPITDLISKTIANATLTLNESWDGKLRAYHDAFGSARQCKDRSDLDSPPPRVADCGATSEDFVEPPRLDVNPKDGKFEKTQQNPLIDADKTGMCVNIVRLRSSAELSGKVGNIIGFDAASSRHIVSLDSHTAPIKIRSCNLVSPARCPTCRGEVTSSRCYACGVIGSASKESHQNANLCITKSDETCQLFVNPSDTSSANLACTAAKGS